jgi:hypothetical protein
MAPAAVSSAPKAVARPIGPHQALVVDTAARRKGRPKVGGDVPLLPARHGPLGNQHWKFWEGNGDSSDEEEEDFRVEKAEDNSWDNPALR